MVGARKLIEQCASEELKRDWLKPLRSHEPNQEQSPSHRVRFLLPRLGYHNLLGLVVPRLSGLSFGMALLRICFLDRHVWRDGLHRLKDREMRCARKGRPFADSRSSRIRGAHRSFQLAATVRHDSPAASGRSDHPLVKLTILMLLPLVAVLSSSSPGAGADARWSRITPFLEIALTLLQALIQNQRQRRGTRNSLARVRNGVGKSRSGPDRDLTEEFGTDELKRKLTGEQP
jgi:hypothetical protein